MSKTETPKVGYTCAYTPLPIIEATGFSPYRVLPLGDSPDQAGSLLHDNLCPHVKRVLDVAMSEETPDVDGMVFVNSCDAMRRLADAWRTVRPDDPVFLLDLPATVDPSAADFLASEFNRLAERLSRWAGRDFKPADLDLAVERFNVLCNLMGRIRLMLRRGELRGGSARMQEICNLASTRTIGESLEQLGGVPSEPRPETPPEDAVPVFLFGNVLPEPQVFSLFESCGARVMGDDFCTGTRMFQPLGESTGEKDVFRSLAASYMKRPPCARTFSPRNPGKIAADVLEGARSNGAKGVIGHTMKFCDPYLDRLPMIRETLGGAGMPLLLLEGDCTLRSLEQQRTRIEAFVEMLR